MSRLLAVSIAIAALVWGARASAQCGDASCLSAGTRPLAVSASTGVLLDSVLSSLAGVTVDLDAGDYQVLATADLSVGELIDRLGLALSLGTTPAILDAEITLAQLLDVAATVATADGDVMAAAALSLAADDLAIGASGTIQLGDLLQVDLREPVLDVCSIGALDLLTNAVSLFNVEHAAVVDGVSVAGSALGLGALINGVTIGVVASEAPTYACGSNGAMLRSSGLRLRTQIDLVDTGSNITVAGLAAARVNLLDLDLVTELAPGGGTLELIDALAGSLTVDATPGVVAVHLGTISDAALLSADPIDPDTDVAPATIGRVDVTLIGGIVQAAAPITAQASASGPAAGVTALAFSAPYPTTLTAQTQGDLAGTLADALVADLEVHVGVLMPAVVLLQPVIDLLVSTVTSTLASPTGLLGTALESVLEQLVDPLFEVLGGGLGEIEINVCAPFAVPSGVSECEPEHDAGVDAGAPDGGDEPDASIADAGADSSANDASTPNDSGLAGGGDGDGDGVGDGDGDGVGDGDGDGVGGDGDGHGDGDAGSMEMRDAATDDDDADRFSLMLSGGGCTIAQGWQNARTSLLLPAFLLGVLLVRRLRRLRQF